MKRWILGWSLAACLVPAVVVADSLDDLLVERERKLESALEVLFREREQWADEEIPLAEELNRLEQQARELRRRVDRQRRIRDSRKLDLDTLRSRVERREQQVQYVRDQLLPEFVAGYASALSIGEQDGRGDALRKQLLALDRNEVSTTALLSTVEDAMTRLESVRGGMQYEGKAADGEGRLIPGTFVQLGPLLLFLANDGTQAGMAVEEPGSLTPRLVPMDGDASERMSDLLADGSAELPLHPDPLSLLQVNQQQGSWADHLSRGGIWVFPIAAFALAATLTALTKAWQIFRIRFPRPAAVHDVVAAMRAGRKEEACRAAEAEPEPAASLLQAAAEHTGESKELIEEVMYEVLLDTQPRLEKYLQVIAVTAATAPLLGLLGTVTGIMKTFRLMAVFGAGDPRPLISGISEALITTELGLALAVPALVMHALLSRRVAGILSQLEKTAVALINGLTRGEDADGA